MKKNILYKNISISFCKRERERGERERERENSVGRFLYGKTYSMIKSASLQQGIVVEHLAKLGSYFFKGN